MFYGVDVFPERLLDHVYRIVISHDPVGPLTMHIHTYEKTGSIGIRKYKARSADYAELCYVVGADPKSRSVMVDLPLIGPCGYSTTQGWFVIDGEEQARDLARYLSKVEISV